MQPVLYLKDVMQRLDASEETSLEEESQLKDTIKRRIEEIKAQSHASSFGVSLGIIQDFRMPFFLWNSSYTVDLFTLEDLKLFLAYAKNTQRAYFIDVGANIGLHSYVAFRLGFKVISLEPDPQTRLDYLKFIEELNSIKVTQTNSFVDFKSSLNLIAAGASNQTVSTDFVRLKSNAFGNHILGAKRNVYGDYEIIKVNLIDVRNSLQDNQFIKIDAEGHDHVVFAAILEHLAFSRSKAIIALCDWRDENSENLLGLLENTNMRCGLNKMDTTKLTTDYSRIRGSKRDDFVLTLFEP